jgi:hypothetical protein
MNKYAFGLIIILLFIVPVAADYSTTPWSWNTYSGTVTWWVTVTEDQTGCSGPVLTNRYSVPIQFSAGSAVMGDVGHGSAGGTFTSENILHIDGRTVADPPGESKLFPYDVLFTPDCSAFTANYTWDYTGPDGNCEGSTSLFGRIASDSCPASNAATIIPTVAPATGEYLTSEIASAHDDLTTDLGSRLERDVVTSMLDNGWIKKETANPIIAGDTATINAIEPKVEGEYQAILAKDPTNFWANSDMAQLRKSQGIWDGNDGYFAYMDKALSNTNIAADTAKTIRDDIVAQYNLATWPDPSDSLFMDRLARDVHSDQNVHGTNIQSTSPGTSSSDTLSLKAFLTFGSGKSVADVFTNVFNKLAYH